MPCTWGVVYRRGCRGAAVAIRETDKLAGSFATTAETAAVRDAMETWSRLVFDALVDGESAAADPPRD